MTQLKRAFNIRRNLGGKSAKGYMRKKGFSLVATIYVMVLP